MEATQMSMIIDVAVIAIILVLTIIYAKKGIVKVLVGIAGFVISLILASTLCHSVGGLIEPLIADAIDGIHIDNSLVNKLASKVLDSSAIATAIAFGLVFLVASLVCKLLGNLANGLGNIPIIGSVNHLVGAILGLILGLGYAQILSIVLFCFSEFLIGRVDWLTAEAFESSIVAKWLFEHNLFTYIFG